MPWTTRSAMDERIRFILAVERGEQTMSELCREFGVSRPTGYRWLARYQETGRVADLRERSRRPQHSPGQTSTEIVDRVIHLRLVHDWGARKLRLLLQREGIAVSESTINRILKREGLQPERDVVGQATRRFEREKPNELWQMDFKGPYQTTTGRCCPLSILDDHSRYLVGLYALANQQAPSVHAVLVQTFERYGVPEAMLVDHGVPWYSPNGHGVTWLAVALLKQGIQLRFSGIRHPQTQGKVERFHRTLGRSVRHRGAPEQFDQWQVSFDLFREEYNQIRPHEQLALAVPASRYQPSPRPYQPNPPAWEYPSGATVRRLNAQGQLSWQHRYYFVSEALAGEWVEVNACAEQLVVRYRHMWIRAIDTKTGRSETLIDKHRNPYV